MMAGKVKMLVCLLVIGLVSGIENDGVMKPT